MHWVGLKYQKTFISTTTIRERDYHNKKKRGNSELNSVEIKDGGVLKGKEQYCIGTWNVRSMNQGKLKVVKQEMARLNVNILGISELKWT